jgi:hypothetical protein
MYEFHAVTAVKFPQTQQEILSTGVVAVAIAIQ